MNSSDKLYVLVRQDISPGYQIAQSIHAKDVFTHTYPSIEETWFIKSNVIVVLGVKDEQDLLRWTEECLFHELLTSLFYEPDIKEFTAMAVEPCEKSTALFASLKTAGKYSLYERLCRLGRMAMRWTLNSQ